MTTAAAAPLTPEDVFDYVKTLLRWVLSAYGVPQQMLNPRYHSWRARRDIIAWLRPIEAMLRQYLLIKAMELPRRNAKPKKSMTHPSFAPRDEDPRNPASWRVTFRLSETPRKKPLTQYRPCKCYRPPDFNPDPKITWALAKRFEAALRVAENIAPYARRLATLLHRSPKRALPLLRRPRELLTARLGEPGYRALKPFCEKAIERLCDILGAPNTS